MTGNYRSFATYNEILSQGEIIGPIIDRWPAPPADLWSSERIVLTGCGSSLFLAQTIAHSWRLRLGLPCRAFPASELLLRPESCFEEDRRTLVLGFSRTGETTETIRALHVARERQGFPIIPVTCYADSTLARLSSRPVVIAEAQEESSIMTRAFTGILAAFLIWAGAGREIRKLPGIIAESLRRHSDSIEELARLHFSQVVFLGTGPFLPLARESALKLTEMTGLPALAVQTFEFRHGNQRVLNSDSLVWLFSGRADVPLLGEVIPDFRNRGAKVLLAGSCLPESLQNQVEFTLNQTCKLAASEVEVAALLHLSHLYAFFRTVHLGGHPDHPEGRSRVTTLAV